MIGRLIVVHSSRTIVLGVLPPSLRVDWANTGGARVPEWQAAITHVESSHACLCDIAPAFLHQSAVAHITLLQSMIMPST